MLVRSAVTARPVLVGFAPGVTFTVSSVDVPAGTVEGDAAPVPLGFVGGAVTVRPIVAEPPRDWASVMLAGSDFPPVGVAGATVAENENVRSPAVASPWVPSSYSVWPGAPPIAVRSAVTARPVLVGLAPGVTATVRSVAPPCTTDDGVAAPVPVGFVGASVPVR